MIWMSLKMGYTTSIGFMMFTWTLSFRFDMWVSLKITANPSKDSKVQIVYKSPDIVYKCTFYSNHVS
jgi:hypothetical protein